MEGGTSLKKITTVGGDGGMIATNNERIAGKCRELRDGGKAKENPYIYNFYWIYS